VEVSPGTLLFGPVCSVTAFTTCAEDYPHDETKCIMTSNSNTCTV